MRTLMRVKIPTAAGNEAIKNGSLPEIIGKALASLNAEVAYFTSEDGLRTALIVFDMTLRPTASQGASRRSPLGQPRRDGRSRRDGDSYRLTAGCVWPGSDEASRRAQTP
jgi:hypothetical protein